MLMQASAKPAVSEGVEGEGAEGEGEASAGGGGRSDAKKVGPTSVTRKVSQQPTYVKHNTVAFNRNVMRSMLPISQKPRH